jgi:hypothetical protein
VTAVTGAVIQGVAEGIATGSLSGALNGAVDGAITGALVGLTAEGGGLLVPFVVGVIAETGIQAGEAAIGVGGVLSEAGPSSSTASSPQICH